jgi:hypothetical protein
MKHTAGPWKVMRHANTFQIVTENGIALVVRPGAIPHQPDAELIALSPELWNELRDLVDRLDRDVPLHACPGFDCATCARPNTQTARALLAKIEAPA